MHVCSKYVKNKILITRNFLRSGSAQYQLCLLGPIPRTQAHTHTHIQVVICEENADGMMTGSKKLVCGQKPVVSMWFIILNPHF